jgi:hypothetical protein
MKLLKKIDLTISGQGISSRTSQTIYRCFWD